MNQTRILLFWFLRMVDMDHAHVGIAQASRLTLPLIVSRMTMRHEGLDDMRLPPSIVMLQLLGWFLHTVLHTFTGYRSTASK
jgi:hypothetical protein